MCGGVKPKHAVIPNIAQALLIKDKGSVKMYGQDHVVKGKWESQRLLPADLLFL